MSHLRSDSESVFTCATVVGACSRSLHRSHGLSARSSQFRKINRIEQRGLPIRAQRVGNVSMHQPEAIILRSGPTDGIAAVQYYVSWSEDEQIKIGHRSYDPSIPRSHRPPGVTQ